MVCQECVRIEGEGYHRVNPNRSGLMTKGLHRVECPECKINKKLTIYEKITDEKILLQRDR